MYFDSVALDKFLWNLKEKHPRAVIVTGEGRGAEKHVKESAKLLGFRVIQHRVTKRNEAWFGKNALDIQISTILTNADIIILVSQGGRVKVAKDWWHRMNMHERDKRGGLVKKKGQYVSLRTTPIKLFEIATAKRGD